MKSRHFLDNGGYIILGLEARCRQDQMFSFICRTTAAKFLKEYLKTEEGNRMEEKKGEKGKRR